MTMRNKRMEVAQYGQVIYKLSRILSQRGIDINELARMTAMNPVIIKRAILGETQPSFEQIARVCFVLNISPADLFEYEKPS